MWCFALCATFGTDGSSSNARIPAIAGSSRDGRFDTTPFPAAIARAAMLVGSACFAARLGRALAPTALA